MITLEKCAEVLNSNGRNYSKEEVKEVREFLYKFARFDELIRNQNDSTENSGDLYSCKHGRTS